MTDELKNVGDGVGVLATAGVLIDLLPAFSAILTIIWFSIRIYETDAVQKYLKERKK